MTDNTEDALNVTLAHPGTNFLAPMEEIEKMPRGSIFPTANYPYAKKMKRKAYEKDKRLLQIELYRSNWRNSSVG